MNKNIDKYIEILNDKWFIFYSIYSNQYNDVPSSKQDFRAFIEQNYEKVKFHLDIIKECEI